MNERSKDIYNEAKKIVAETEETNLEEISPLLRLIMIACFTMGAKWADAHPHWISVEDELPPRWETNPNVSVPVITFGTLGESSIPFVELQRYHFGDGRWQYGDATHWMPFQYPKKGD